MFITEDARDYVPVRRTFRFLEGHNGYLAGGAFKNLFTGEKVRDFDIFFESEEDFLAALPLFLEDDRYTEHYENTNVVAFRDENGDVIELVRSNYMSPQQAIERFDFTIVKFVLFTEDEPGEEPGDEPVQHFKVMYHDRFFEHLNRKMLIIEAGSTILPFNTFERSLKYTARGYKLCSASKVRLIEAMRAEPVFDGQSLRESLYLGID